MRGEKERCKTSSRKILFLGPTNFCQLCVKPPVRFVYFPAWNLVVWEETSYRLSLSPRTAWSQDDVTSRRWEVSSAPSASRSWSRSISVKPKKEALYYHQKLGLYKGLLITLIIIKHPFFSSFSVILTFLSTGRTNCSNETRSTTYCPTRYSRLEAEESELNLKDINRSF